MKSNQFDAMKGGLNTVIGRMKTQDRLWVVDMDDCHLSDTFPVIEYINTLQPTDITQKCRAVIPTKNGYHLITTAFNVQEFSKQYPNIQIHKNNPTVLYIS